MRSAFTSFLLFISVFSFSQPAGYYNTATGTGATLKTQLCNIITNGHSPISYNAIWNAFETTDDKANGKVWDMYSDIPDGTPPYEFTFGSDQCGTYSAEGDCYNREHSFPVSWFGDVLPMNTDLNHIVPTDGYVNSRRSNYILAEVGSASWTSLNGSKLGSCSTPGYSGTVFEPIDEYKGDFARNYFYMVTRYENLIVGWSSNAVVSDILDGTTYPGFQSWYLTMLGEWSASDPVSQKEIDRNNAVYAIQGNRNPYIDHPEFIFAVWGVGASAGLAVSPSSLSGFTYSEGTGPSASQSFSVSGSSLLPAAGNITVSGSDSYEVSTNNSTFSSAVSLPYSSSALSATTVYVRLKAGLTEADYSGELIAVSGGSANPVNVICNGNVSVMVYPEPTNYPLSFSAHNIHLQWVDATGDILPDGYLIRASSTGFSAIEDPVNGTVYPDGILDKNVAYGTQQVRFSNLNSNTTYYFKLFGYKGAGSARLYKTDGSVPQASQTTIP